MLYTENILRVQSCSAPKCLSLVIWSVSVSPLQQSQHVAVFCKLTSLSDLFPFPLQIVLENSSREDKHECPFGRSSIELTKMLCEILKVGELRKYACFPQAGRDPVT